MDEVLAAVIQLYQIYIELKTKDCLQQPAMFCLSNLLPDLDTNPSMYGSY
jgi:hypothetical protein